MIVYSVALGFGLALAAPWWGWRMLRSGRYREGLGQRLGRVTPAVRLAVAGKRVVWVHAVSVGEVLAVVRLVAELQARLESGWVVAVSTTTATGQAVARQKLGHSGSPVFFFPLDFGFAVRAWMRVLRPRLVVLVEGELWPRMLAECERGGVPVAVVNARVSDRSYQRTLRVRRLWLGMGQRVTLFLAQGAETAGRLLALGVQAERVRIVGNLKYDLAPSRPNAVAEWVRRVAAGRKVLVAGSTLAGEEEMVLRAWSAGLRGAGVVLVLAPRHPERFEEVFAMAAAFKAVRASRRGEESNPPGALPSGQVEVVVLDTLGDLASVYEVASVAFVGGSLVARGGHNPLEAARFAVPVVMGSSFENFREIVEGMLAADAVRVVGEDGLTGALAELLADDGGMGARGQAFFDRQAGATGRTVAALLEVLGRDAQA